MSNGEAPEGGFRRSHAFLEGLRVEQGVVGAVG